MVVLTSSTLADQQHIADLCHQSGIAVIVADTRGLFGSVATLLCELSVKSVIGSYRSEGNGKKSVNLIGSENK